MFTVSSLLNQLSEETAVEVRKLEKILKLTKKNERNKLSIALSALDKLGVLECKDDGILKRINDDNVFEARLRSSSKGYCFAVREDCAGEDIYIRDNFLNHAWHGDKVLVKITKEAVRRRSPEGIVQCILERVTNNILCTIENDEDYFIAVPLDDRVLTSIQLDPTDSQYFDSDNKENLVEVKIDHYPIGQYEAKGHVIRPLPLNAGNDGDLDILLAKNNLQTNSLSPRSTIKTPADKNRRDLIDQSTLILRSWQDANSPPLPAISVEPNNGGVRLWVHAPSVSERVTIGNNLDNWLYEHSESHCLGTRWLPLLNKALKEASQFEVGVINKALTVQLDITSDGVIENWEFFLSNIKPVAQISSDHLKSLNSRKPRSRAIPTALKPIKDQINQLQTIIYCANALLTNEKSNGLIELDIPVPSLESLVELSFQSPGLETSQWKSPLNNEDPQSLLNPIVRAANRAIGEVEHLSMQGQLELRVLQLPSGKDPDEFLKDHGTGEYRALLDQSPLWLDWQIEQVLDENRSPSRKVGEIDNRGSHFYIAKYWAQELAAQNEDQDLKTYFNSIAVELNINESKIVNELLAAQGAAVDLNGYYHPPQKKISAAMRPSLTFNKIIDQLN